MHVIKSFRVFVDVRKNDRGVNFTPPARDRVKPLKNSPWVQLTIGIYSRLLKLPDLINEEDLSDKYILFSFTFEISMTPTFAWGST